MCTLAASYTPKTCKTPSGTKEFLLANFENLTTVTATAGIITAITMKTGTKFFLYKQKAEVSNWKQTGTSDAKAGTYAYDIEANIELAGLDAAGQLELDSVMKSTLAVIAHDNDGLYWLLGQDYGMDVASDGLDSGTALGDFRGDKIQLKGRGFTRICTVDPTIIAALLIVAP